MDDLDIKILRELSQGRRGFPVESDVRKSYRSMAKRLKIDEVTFRNRLKRIQRGGYLQGWQLGLNPSLLGVKFGQSFLFDVQFPMGKDELVKELGKAQGVVTIIDYYGSSLAVGAIRDSIASMEGQSEHFAKLSGAQEVVSLDFPFPKCKIGLTPTDWRIVKAIWHNPRQSYYLISKEVGVSLKTVKRRLGKMNEEGALFAIPRMNIRALEGAMVVDLVVFYSNAEAKADVDHAIISQFGESLSFAISGGAEAGFFSFIIGKVSQTKEILSWVRRQPGVRRAFVELVEDRIELYDTFTELLDKKLREMSPRPGAHS